MNRSRAPRIAIRIVLFVYAPLAAARDGEPFDVVRPLVVASRADGTQFERGEILIGLESAADRDSVLAAVGGEPLGWFPAHRLLRVAVAPGTEDAACAAAQRLPGVAYAELNGVGSGGAIPPNDPSFTRQWHLQNTGQSSGTPGADIDAVGAWGIQTGSSDVVVAVLDSGIDFTSPEFTGRTLPGFDFVAEDADPTFDHPHGIFVTALLAANADNAFGVAGVDHHCTLLPVKVLNAANLGTVTDLMQGIDYAVAQGADILSMSLVNYPPSTSLVSSLAAARAAGVILVACGGNAGIGNADVTYPGASPLTISIGWTDNDDVRASSSSTGSALDFVAPGDGVETLKADGSDAATKFSGCSAATPIAAGIVALLKAQNPSLTQDQIYELLVAGAEDQVGPPNEDTPGKDAFYGHGRLNAFESLMALCGCTSAAPFVSSPQTISLSAGGAQLLRLDAGAAFAGRTYLVLGSFTGTAPGLPIGAQHLPLNYDFYMSLLLTYPNTVIPGSLGALDGAGRAEAGLGVPPGVAPALAGTTLRHAYLVFSSAAPAAATANFASNAVALTFVP